VIHRHSNIFRIKTMFIQSTFLPTQAILYVLQNSVVTVYHRIMNTNRIYTTETETTSGVVSNINDSVSKRQRVCAWIVWTYLCHCSLFVFSMCMDLSRGSGGCSSSRQEPHGIKTARMEGSEVGASSEPWNLHPTNPSLCPSRLTVR
jgi:hypothetical protein